MDSAEITTLGIDLGATYARAAVVDRAGRILSASRVALADRSPEAVVESIGVAAEEALAGSNGRPVGKCGVGVAAQLEGATGHVAVAPNLGWRDVPFGKLLVERLARPVLVVNDLSAAAWGEFRVGAAKGVRDVFVLFVGSGVGSAIISNAQLVQGATGVAAELGHIKVVPEGRPCGCGERGCLEAYVGGHNLIAQMREAVEAGRGQAMLELADGEPSRLTPLVLERAYERGDPAAAAIYGRAVGFLELAAANAVTVLNPARLILGGGVLSHCPGMMRRVTEGVYRYASWVSRQVVKVVPAALGDDSGLIGAALLASEPGV